MGKVHRMITNLEEPDGFAAVDPSGNRESMLALILRVDALEARCAAAEEAPARRIPRNMTLVPDEQLVGWLGLAARVEALSARCAALEAGLAAAKAPPPEPAPAWMSAPTWADRP